MTALHLLNALRAREDHHATNLEKTKQLWKKFGHEVRAERRRKKIRLQLFADKLKVSRAMVSYLEAGTREWSMDRASDAVSALNRPECWPDVVPTKK